MSNEIIPASKELQDADTALRRAAQTAKRLAEQNGTPYVVYRGATICKILSQNQTNNKK